MGKESKYSAEFHKGLLQHYDGQIHGWKIHGSMFQSGVPDYIYVANASIFFNSFFGSEAKFLNHKKYKAAKTRTFEGMCTDLQLEELCRVDEAGGVGMLVTFVEHKPRKFAAIFIPITRGKTHVISKELKDWIDLCYLDGQDVSTYSVENNKLIILYRNSKVPHYDYEYINGMGVMKE